MEGGGCGIFSDFIAAFALPDRLFSNLTQVRTEYIPSTNLGCLQFIRREEHSLDRMILAPGFWCMIRIFVSMGMYSLKANTLLRSNLFGKPSCTEDNLGDLGGNERMLLKWRFI